MFKTESGYTLVETLIANALFLAVLIPALVIFGNMTLRNAGEKKIVAYELAKQHLELALVAEQLSNSEKKVPYKEREWTVKTRIININGLTEIAIAIYQNEKGKPLAQLYRLRNDMQASAGGLYDH